MNAGIPILVGGAILGITAAIVVHLGTRNTLEKKIKKVYGSRVYADLCAFQYYVMTCELNLLTYSIIDDRLKIERARPEMEDVVFNNKVGEIQRIFDRRYTFNIK